MQNKRLLLIGGNFFPEPTGIGKYTGEMVDWLSKNGFRCTVVTTFPYYPYWKVQEPYLKRSFWFKKETRQVSEDGLPIEIIRAPHYVPTKPTGVRRMISDFSFFFSAYLVIIALLFKRRNDFVMTVAPPFQLGLLAILYKKLKGSKFIYHIQDLQVDAAKDLRLVESEAIIDILFRVEKFILRHADTISTISIGMAKKVRIKCGKDVCLFPNWVDTTKFFPIVDKERIKVKFGFNPSDRIILYSGAIGEKQGLEAIIYAAKEFKEVTNLKFLICGSGPYKEKLKLLKEKLQLPNVVFYPLQPLDTFNEFLNIADFHLLLQKQNASDLVMPSKLTAILSIGGIAIITAKKGTSLFEIIDTARAGILIEPENQLELNNAIKKALFTGNLRALEVNARMFAEKNLAIAQILSEYKATVLKTDTNNGRKYNTRRVRTMTPIVDLEAE
jgi:colanic acid biosynthesis glycosyl transferase WcaI